MPIAKTLVVDTGALLNLPLSQIRGLADVFYVTSDVVAELKDKRGRDLLQESQLHLTSTSTNADGKTTIESGLKVLDPSAEAVAKATQFAKHTGDLAVLSRTDLRVVALCLMLEWRDVGHWRIRNSPTDPPGHVKKDEQKNDSLSDVKKDEQKSGSQSDVEKDEQKNDSQSGHAQAESSSANTPKTATAAPSKEPASTKNSSEAKPEKAPAAKDSTADKAAKAFSALSLDDDDDDGEGDWITPENVRTKKMQGPAGEGSVGKKVNKPVKVGMITGDYAMQNVGMQIGLNVIDPKGELVKSVRTWILRCYSCYNLCKDPMKQFCPSCGNATLTRVSISYLPVSKRHPEGYVLHLKKNYHYNNRGTVFSLPRPKPGKAGGIKEQEYILRADQREYLQGLKAADRLRRKEDRAASKQAAQGYADWQDPDWLPSMQRPRDARAQGANAYLDNTGRPIIGAGRRNPNAGRRRK